MAAGSSGHSEIFLDKLKKLESPFTVDSAVGGGWRHYRHFTCRDSVWSLLNFGVKNVDFCGGEGGYGGRGEKRGGVHFCAMLYPNPLQNHECNILPCMVSHVTKFDEIKVSNLKRIRPYLHIGQTK